ncbi:MAG: ATP synthase subunit I [Syntrophaceae bacterium]|nr:ATP synthase subunit I [Syntrophaceae bacterium]
MGLLVSSLLAPYHFTVAYLIGSLLVLTNSWLSARKVGQATFRERNQAMISIMGGFYVRLAVIGLCLFALIKYVNIDPVGLIAGLTVMPAGLIVMLVLIYISNRRPQEVQ